MYAVIPNESFVNSVRIAVDAVNKEINLKNAEYIRFDCNWFYDN